MAVALLIPSVELIIGLVGSTIGVAICIMFPAASFRQIIKKDSAERSLTQLLIVGGFCLMILGTYANLSAIDEQRSGAHLEELPLMSEVTKLPPALMEKPKYIEPSLDDSPKMNKDAEEMLKKNEMNLQQPKPEVNLKLLDDKKPVIMPLPVDDKHDEHEKQNANIENKPKEEEYKVLNKMQAISPVPDKVAEEKPALKLELPKPSAALPAAENINQNSANAQLINKEAIKKDEEVIAEEAASLIIKQKEDELNKTKIELAETKQLLQITKEELKQEFAKQNKETQQLVKEKLAEVVAKIEEKVNSANIAEVAKQTAIENNNNNDSNAVNNTINAATNNAPAVKGTLLQRLSEAQANSPANANEVYEPLSYKTGELMENTKNDSKLEQRLRLPLPLLINASQTKTNNEASINNKLPNIETINKTDENVPKIQNAQQAQNVNSAANADKALNVDSAAFVRNKRNAEEDINEKSAQELYLPQPKVNDLVKMGSSNALDIKLHALTGSELKTLQKSEVKK